MSDARQGDARWMGWIFLGGLGLHILYLVALLNVADMDGMNWYHGDSRSYIRPAQSFVEAGEFLRNGVPDSARTIGYPLFLAGAIKLGSVAGIDWRIITFVVQSVLFALAYPAIFYLGRKVFRLPKGVALGCVGFVVFSGAFVSYVTTLLSDAMFSTALLVGMACGFEALRRRSIGWGLLHVCLITYAGMVRPLLVLYPVAATLMHWGFVRASGWPLDRPRVRLLVAMFLLAMAGVQFSSLRNWVNHGAFTASEIGSINLCDYVARTVLLKNQQMERAEALQASLAGLAGVAPLAERVAARQRHAFSVYAEYPGSTMAFLMFNGLLNSLETHWQNTFFWFGHTWYRSYGNITWSPVPCMCAILFVILYGCLYLAALFQVYSIRKQWWWVVSGVLFMVPFALCATSFQGARFRLWFEPLIVLAAAPALQSLWRNGRLVGRAQKGSSGFSA